MINAKQHRRRRITSAIVWSTAAAAAPRPIRRGNPWQRRRRRRRQRWPPSGVIMIFPGVTRRRKARTRTGTGIAIGSTRSVATRSTPGQHMGVPDRHPTTVAPVEAAAVPAQRTNLRRQRPRRPRRRCPAILPRVKTRRTITWVRSSALERRRLSYQSRLKNRSSRSRLRFRRISPPR
uniref:(northern house mosquito) hypothetical protein n=1 Tax=Culex pipiens TaxID=7175 RepID=A0A8D8H609_CULPI